MPTTTTIAQQPAAAHLLAAAPDVGAACGLRQVEEPLRDRLGSLAPPGLPARCRRTRLLVVHATLPRAVTPGGDARLGHPFGGSTTKVDGPIRRPAGRASGGSLTLPVTPRTAASAGSPGCGSHVTRSEHPL